MVQIIPRAQPSFGEQIASGLQSGYQKGEQFGQQIGRDVLAHKHRQKELQSKLTGDVETQQKTINMLNKYFGPEAAEVYPHLTEGGKTALFQSLLLGKERGENASNVLTEYFNERPEELKNIYENFNQPKEERRLEESSEEADIFPEISRLKKEQDKGLLPTEKIARGKERYATGLKEYQEASTKLHGMARDKERLDILNTLNASDKLPKGLGRVNVDLKEGNLRLPTAASPEAQRFVKTLNEFSANAKDTFGARVTNFDLAQYMKRFPTLLNTKEGRRQIIDQMKIVNQINSVYHKNLKRAYDEAGGVRNIDSDVAARIADQLSEPTVNKLVSKFQEIGQFTSKPNPAEFKGRRIVDEKTGEIFVSDGNEWVPEGD